MVHLARLLLFFFLRVLEPSDRHKTKAEGLRQVIGDSNSPPLAWGTGPFLEGNPNFTDEQEEHLYTLHAFSRGHGLTRDIVSLGTSGTLGDFDSGAAPESIKVDIGQAVG